MINNNKVIGLICETNPFHEGHKKIINIAKNQYNADYIVAIMSGNFVQRGELSVYDKYAKTKTLLENNVDLVIELPVEFVLSSAKYFAFTAINILNKLSFIDNIIFGSNINNLEILNNLSNKLNTALFNYDNNIEDDINKIINYELKQGNSYSKAISTAFDINLTPNDILGIEYLSALKKINSSITPICIERDKKLKGASEIRAEMDNKTDYNIFSDYLNQILFYNYHSQYDFTNYYDIDIDFANSLYNMSLKNISFEERVNILNKKNRTKANVKRNLLHILLNIKQEDMNKINFNNNYIRVLGFNKKSDILKFINIPFITSYNPISIKNFNNKYYDINNDLSYKINLYSSNLYSFATNMNTNEYDSQVVII